MSQSQSLSALIWSVADLLRGDYKPSEYGKVILPFTWHTFDHRTERAQWVGGTFRTSCSR